MTTRTGIFKVQQVSRKGGIRLFGNSWLRPTDGYNPDDLEVKAGWVYRFTFDDTRLTVSRIEATHPDKPNCHIEYDPRFKEWTAWHTCPHCGRSGGYSDMSGAARSRSRLQDVLWDFNQLPLIYIPANK